MESKFVLVAVVAFCVVTVVSCIPRVASIVSEDSKQSVAEARAPESSTADFVRLVVMRLIYGIASTMGLEERLSDMFNGAFVPPGEEDGDYGFELDGAEDLFGER